MKFETVLSLKIVS